MKNKSGKAANTLTGVIIVIFLWTCMILCTKYNFDGDFTKQCQFFLLKTGLNNVDIFNAISNKKSNMKWNLTFGSSSLMTYIADNEDNIGENTDKGVEKIVMAYPGYSSRNLYWSGAGSDMSVGDNLFERSDVVLAELEEENDEAAVIAENNAARTKNEGKEEKYKEESAENKDDVNKRISAKNEDSDDLISSSGGKVNKGMIKRLKKSKSRSYLLKNFYIVDSSTSIDNSIFNTGKLLNMDLSIKKSKKPQILIFHTHGASEAFADSRKNKKSDSIIGVGEYLSKILREKYGYNVIHDRTPYDMINGRIDRNKAYNNAGNSIKKTLKKYPSIQVVIDLHRDGVGNSVHRTTVINGKKTAQVMFFNGLSRNASGDINYLHNPNLQANLAFSLQMKIKCMEKYKNFAKPVYLKGYRYNMHLKKRYLLIELGNENNKVSEAKNAMKPLADVLNSVLIG